MVLADALSIRRQIKSIIDVHSYADKSSPLLCKRSAVISLPPGDWLGMIGWVISVGVQYWHSRSSGKLHVVKLCIAYIPAGMAHL